MKEIKVLYVTRKYPPQIGGMENFCYNLSKGLEKKKGIQIKIVKLSKDQSNLIWFFPYACIYVFFNARKYDVIFIGDAVLCFLGVISKIVSSQTKRVINVFGLDISFENILYQIYLKMFYTKCSDQFISISKDTDKLLHTKWSNINSTIITPGINVKVVKRNIKSQNDFKEKYKISEGHIVLLTVGRLVKRKGVEWFIKSVMPFFKGESIDYYIIGDGENRGNIEQAIYDLGMTEQIHLLGKVDQDVVDEFYSNADIFIMPNIYVKGDKEGFGIVASEASAAGMIVLASGIEGIRDAIIDGKNGYLLPEADGIAFRDKIREYIKNFDKYEKKRAVFSEYTKEKFAWENVCEQYTKVFRKILD